MLQKLTLASVLALLTVATADRVLAEPTTTQVPAPVTLYVQPDCGYCAEARGLLEARGVQYRERDIEDPQVRADWRAIGGQGVPLLLIGEARIQGFNPEQIEQALVVAGY